MAGPWMISAGRSCWRLVDLSAPGCEDRRFEWEGEQPPAHRAAELVEAMTQTGNDDPRVLLGLASSQCLAAQIETDGIDRGSRHRSMSFRLEEHLPLSAEDSVADFSEYARDRALGVCCRLDELDSLIGALEAEGLEVVSAVSEALLAAQAARARAGQAQAVLLHWKTPDGDGEATDLDWVEIEQSQPRLWRWFGDDLESCQRQMRQWADQESKSLVLVGPGGGIQTPEGIEAICLEGATPRSLATEQARRVLAGQTGPWVDLRRGPLAPKARRGRLDRTVSALVAVATLLLLSLLAVFYWRAQQYDELRSGYVREQIKVFRKAVPDQEPPLDVRGRMRSELRKLAGLRGQGSPDAQPATSKQISAMIHLRNVLAHLPSDVRFRIEKLDIRPDEIRMYAQGRNFAQADEVALSLQASGLYDVEMHETNALDEDKVGFSFSARPSEGFESARVGGRP